jgi:hypothetical protein
VGGSVKMGWASAVATCRVGPIGYIAIDPLHVEQNVGGGFCGVGFWAHIDRRRSVPSAI